MVLLEYGIVCLLDNLVTRRPPMLSAEYSLRKFSPLHAQRPLCVVGRLGRGKNEGARETMGREEERKRAISSKCDLSPVFLGNPAPSWSHNMAEAPAFSFLPSLLFLLFLLEYPAGSSAEERARKVWFRAGFRNGLATHSSTRKQVTTTSPNSKRNILTIFLILQRLLFWNIVDNRVRSSTV